MQGMTGFGQAHLSWEGGSIQCVVRSVNRGHLEVVARLPEGLQAMETALRSCIAACIPRGHVEVSVEVTTAGDRPGLLCLDHEAIQMVYGWLNALPPPPQGFTPLDPLALLRWPGILRPNHNAVQSLRTRVMAVLEEALSELLTQLMAEGRAVREAMEGHLAQARSMLHALQESLPAVTTTILGAQAWLHERLTPEERQVVLRGYPSWGVAEELQRLDHHLAALEDTMARTGAVGKRIDLIAQEALREATTLSAKLGHASLAAYTLGLRQAISAIREQAHNVA